jgi:hypothetical protein
MSRRDAGRRWGAWDLRGRCPCDAHATQAAACQTSRTTTAADTPCSRSPTNHRPPERQSSHQKSHGSDDHRSSTPPAAMASIFHAFPQLRTAAPRLSRRLFVCRPCLNAHPPVRSLFAASRSCAPRPSPRNRCDGSRPSRCEAVPPLGHPTLRPRYLQMRSMASAPGRRAPPTYRQRASHTGCWGAQQASLASSSSAA